MPGIVDVGTGTTITFGTSSYPAQIVGLTVNGETVPVIDIAHLGSVGTRPKMLGDLKEPVSLEVQMHLDPSLTIPTGIPQTITVTFPVPATLTNGATLQGSGAITGHSAAVPLEDKMTGSYTVQYLDGATRVAAS